MVTIINDSIPSTINGIQLTPLKQITDDRGAVLHMVKRNNLTSEFGEVYFSEVLPGKIKAWKRHKKMKQNFAVPFGRIKMAFFDDREQSASNGILEELVIGRPDQYYLVHVPPLVWYGFQGLGDTPSILANCADMVHDPNESDTREPFDAKFLYQW